ncbi:hypothetical protein IMG5_075220 [Ichthyophthirius multifiliis]|uniref:Uncharacterized protein n=1 Tax=Ichthyophthirius multifiliis TaxID=5932 RepID=G0QQ43_ICHMU|nr:hypothetical protein IMG5_075220 [Ichthyophthirius multifiliis]EGR32657.1 hypothetical protein IMG5_075220 [Ichthyophthirius multifiliis]|eukprot:XP_004036643.1 hypothetical protein IMG5_075220 [Ichthyophthirius multifiliis]
MVYDFQKPKFENVLLSQTRQNIPPQDSMKKLVNYALLQDARLRSRSIANNKASMIVALLFFSPPCLYFIKGLINGCWNALSNRDKLTLGFVQIGRPMRLMYRPEIYLRDQAASLYELEKENIEKSRQGEQDYASSPIVLWI